MIEPPLNFLEVEVEVLPRHSPELGEPVLGKGPEPLNTVEMITALGHPSFLPYDHMVATDGKEGVGKPVVRVVEATGFGVGSNERNQRVSGATGNGEG